MPRARRRAAASHCLTAAAAALWGAAAVALAFAVVGPALHHHVTRSASAGLVVAALALGTAACALLARALRRMSAHQRRAAILDERRRLARDLHDGLAQELAYIKMESRRVAAAEPEGRAAALAQVADHALDEMRVALAGLRRHAPDTFEVEVSEVAEQLAGRAGARLWLNLDQAADIDPEHQDPLLRIVREAVTNGVNHGRASEVWIELSGEECLRLRVRDNGTGFSPKDADPDHDGQGLIGMRERVRALGGELHVRSRPGSGTEVEVVFP
jgi:signal transduction histidine kinase